jgi:WD40 repeat protein
VHFSQDGTKLASGSYDNTIKIWDLKTRSVDATLEGHTQGVSSVHFSSDGNKLASGS